MFGSPHKTFQKNKRDLELYDIPTVKKLKFIKKRGPSVYDYDSARLVSFGLHSCYGKGK